VARVHSMVKAEGAAEEEVWDSEMERVQARGVVERCEMIANARAMVKGMDAEKAAEEHTIEPLEIIAK